LVRSKTSTLNQLERWVSRFRSETGEKRLVIHVNPELALMLKSGTFSRLRKMMLKHFVWITLEADKAVPPGEYRCHSVKQDKDITEQFK
jgi:hypothetical protein